MRIRAPWMALASVGLLVAGCNVNSPSSSSDNAVPPSDIATSPIFQPLTQSASRIPFPVDLLFSGSLDGTLNIPGVANTAPPGVSPAAPENSPTMADLADPMVALNTATGYSTTAMMTIPFNAQISASQANLKAGIRVFETTSAAGAGNFILGATPTGAVELTYGVDFVASVSGKTVAIVPLRPLNSATSYIIAVTTALKDVSGDAVVAGGSYASARVGKLLPLKASLTPKVRGQECLVAATAAAGSHPVTVLNDAVKGTPCAGLPFTSATQDDIALTYSVTTQNVTAALAAAQAEVKSTTAPTIAVSPAPAAINKAVATAVKAVDGNGDPIIQIYAGKVSGMVSFLNPADPVHSIWNNAGHNLSQVNAFTPDVQGTVDVPVVVTAPLGAQLTACGGDVTQLPVIIYQHGITSNRGTLLALAGSLAKACQVAVAIDMPEHGILPDGTFGQLTAFNSQFGVSERLVKSGAYGPAPQGCMDPTKAGKAADGSMRCAAGDSYINLTNLANSRDVLRQSVIDLDSLYRAIATNGVVIVNASATPVGTMGDSSKVSFIGMSLGSIVGETFVATLDNISATPFKAAVFNVGGGGIAKLLDGSPSIEPTVVKGLASQGVSKPSAQYESFLIAAQTLIDSADPINYADELASLSTPILFQEVVGGKGLPDQTVPNNVYGTAFGKAWGLISGSHQQGWLANQNPLTVPNALSGADPLVQGTAFVSTAIAVQAGIVTPATVIANGGPLFKLPGSDAFTGIGLPQIGPAGSTGSGVVRFKSGYHGSLLDPDGFSLADPAVTKMMQTQVAGFIKSASLAGTATIPGESACGTGCVGTIANWKPLQ